MDSSTSKTDTGKLRIAEAREKLSEEKYRALFECSPNGIALQKMLYDQAGNPVDFIFIEVNKNYEKLAGANPVGKRATEVFPGIENDPDDWIGTFARVAMTGQTVRLERHIKAVDRWYDIVAYRPMADHFVVVFNEITERKRSERQFVESERRFRNIAQASPMGMYLYELEPDDRLVLIDSNPAADHYTGVRNQELIGKSIEEAFPPLADTEIPERYREAARDGITWRTESFEYDDNQISGVFDVHAFQTSPGRMAVFFLDITERKKAEEELRRLRNLLSNIVDSMPSVLVGVDAEGRVTQWNREAQLATGHSPDTARGRPLADIYPLLANQMPNVREAVRTGQPQREEKVVSERDDQTRLADITVYPLVADGVEGAVIRVDDITERVAMEEMVIQSEKMLSVGGMAAGLAHEINNPLAGILQNAQVIQNRLSSSTAKNRETAQACGTTLESIQAYMASRKIFVMLDSIVESSRRAASTVSNMLSFSRKSESDFAPHDLADLLEKTLDLASNDYDLGKKLNFQKIQIERQYAPDFPKVSCQKGKIQQVLLNILKNATQAMAQQKREPRLTLRLLLDGQWARVEIEDNGPGMDETTRRRVFEPFFTTKDPGAGTGLGLSLSYFIITENHGGKMLLESAPDAGTNCVIQLPLKRNQTDA